MTEVSGTLHIGYDVEFVSPAGGPLVSIGPHTYSHKLFRPLRVATGS
jgi:hypothetical protein